MPHTVRANQNVFVFVCNCSGGSGSHRVTLETSLKKEAAEKAKAKEAMQRENPPVYLCCSQQEPEDFQVNN